MQKGKTAIVTGSTSGIGHGIAAALAAEGCDVMLNGFGEAAAIERLRAGIAERHGVRAAYSPADMSKPAEIGEAPAKLLALFVVCREPLKGAFFAIDKLEVTL